jgi:hypothetical protein
MTAIQKTKDILRLPECPLSLMVKNVKNPNKMKPREFDLLCDNLNRTGWTDPALAVPYDLDALAEIRSIHGKDIEAITKAMVEQDIKVRLVGGHHRFDAASFLDFDVGPVNIIMDPNFTEEEEQFQIVRMNVIHGKLDPQAFFEMYKGLEEKYSDEILQDAFGFAEEAEFKKLINQMSKTLPDKATQDKFKEAAQEIKTIDGLAKLLNTMFTRYGDTVPFGYMVVDYGGQESMWLRVSGKTWKALGVLGDICIERHRTVDDILGTIVQLIAKGDSPEFIDEIVSQTPEVKLPKGLQTAPTKDNIEKLEALNG